MQDNTTSNATIDQSIKMPDYFSCHNCAAKAWAGEMCAEFQAAGRCRADMLRQALQSGAVQVVLYLPGK